MLAGIPKPQVSVSWNSEKAQPLVCLGCVETLESQLDITMLIYKSGCQQHFPLPSYERIQSHQFGVAPGNWKFLMPKQCKPTALHVTQGSLLIRQGGCASICSHLCSQFETVSKPTKLLLRHLSSPVFCWHLSCPFPPLSHLLY